MTTTHPIPVRYAGATAIVDLKGDLSHETEGPLLAALRDPRTSSHRFILLNFTSVGYINSAGISLLISLLAESLPNERTMMACCLSPHYQKIFRMVGLTSFLSVFESEAAALQWTAARRG